MKERELKFKLEQEIKIGKLTAIITGFEIKTESIPVGGRMEYRYTSDDIVYRVYMGGGQYVELNEYTLLKMVK